MMLFDEKPQYSADDIWRSTVLPNTEEAQLCTKTYCEALNIYQKAYKANPKDRRFKRSRSAFISAVR